MLLLLLSFTMATCHGRRKSGWTTDAKKACQVDAWCCCCGGGADAVFMCESFVPAWQREQQIHQPCYRNIINIWAQLDRMKTNNRVDDIIVKTHWLETGNAYPDIMLRTTRARISTTMTMLRQRRYRHDARRSAANTDTANDDANRSYSQYPCYPYFSKTLFVWCPFSPAQISWAVFSGWWFQDFRRTRDVDMQGVLVGVTMHFYSMKGMTPTCTHCNTVVCRSYQGDHTAMAMAVSTLAVASLSVARAVA